jgi:hypothetical protein
MDCISLSSFYGQKLFYHAGGSLSTLSDISINQSRKENIKNNRKSFKNLLTDSMLSDILISSDKGF